jgi:predicted N-acetyltransferase YhbS
MSPEVEVRLLRPEDVDSIVAIDARITGQARPEYYRHKLQASTLHEAQISTSLVAVVDGQAIGFLMGTLFFGEFGIPESSAVVDTLGVDPAHQDRGAGGALITQFLANMKAAGVEKIYTLVEWRDFGLLKFFGNMGFVPSQRLSLECPVR